MTNKTRKGTVMNVEIAQRLAELRRERGFSQEGLAEQLGLSRQAVSKWERAESAPDMGNLIALGGAGSCGAGRGGGRNGSRGA